MASRRAALMSRLSGAIHSVRAATSSGANVRRPKTAVPVVDGRAVTCKKELTRVEVTVDAYTGVRWHINMTIGEIAEQRFCLIWERDK